MKGWEDFYLSDVSTACISTKVVVVKEELVLVLELLQAHYIKYTHTHTHTHKQHVVHITYIDHRCCGRSIG